MTKPSDLGPPIPGQINGPEPADEQVHFYTCSGCGQLVDMRDLEAPDHEQLELEK